MGVGLSVSEEVIADSEQVLADKRKENASVRVSHMWGTAAGRTQSDDYFARGTNTNQMCAAAVAVATRQGLRRDTYYWLLQGTNFSALMK